MNDGYKGTQRPNSGAGQFNAMSYLIRSILNRTATITLVRVEAVESAGGVSEVGFVDVQPMVHQIDGDGGIMPHGIIHHIPYFRLQGGANAVIMDPQKGDIGLCAFAHSDLSGVKANRAPSAPGSKRRFDMADGLYIGGFLNGVPSQYIAFTSEGIEAVSPTKFTARAPDIELDGAVTMTQTAAVTGDLTAAGKSVSAHTHNDPQGGTTSGPN